MIVFLNTQIARVKKEIHKSSITQDYILCMAIDLRGIEDCTTIKTVFLI